MSNLINLYTSVLQAGGCVVDGDGFVSINQKAITNLDNVPFTIGGKRVVLPTETQLRDLYGSDKIVFHPLYENALHGESTVVAKFRNMCSVKLSFTLASVMNGMLTLAASVAEHKKLNPDQSEVLVLLKDVDETTCVNFAKYLANVTKAGNPTHFANIYLKRGGSYKKTKYNRVSIINFDAYKEFKKSLVENSKEPIGNVKFRIKDRDAIVKLFEYILSEMTEDDEAYNFGSNSEVAPFMHALMKGFGKVAARLNDILALFNKHIPNHEALVFDANWVEAFDNLSSWQADIRAVPMQNGNEGNARNNSAVPVPTTAKTEVLVPVVSNAPTSIPVVPVGTTVPTPVPVANPTVQTNLIPVPQTPTLNTGDKIDFRAAMNAVMQNPNIPTIPMVNNGFPYQNQQMPQVYGQQMNNFNPGFNNGFPVFPNMQPQLPRVGMSQPQQQMPMVNQQPMNMGNGFNQMRSSSVF